MNKIVSYGFVFVGLTLALLAGPSEVETLSFAMQSDSLVETTADVSINVTRKHQKGPDTQRVEYSYVVDGRRYRSDNHLTGLTDRPYEVNQLVHKKGDEQTIQVWYLPDDPSVSSIHKDVGVWIPLSVLGITALFLMIGFDGVRAQKKAERGRAMA